MVPRLPIPNRTVKRLSADDSVVLPCESRSLPNTYSKPLTDVGGFLLRIVDRFGEPDIPALIAAMGRNGVILRMLRL